MTQQKIKVYQELASQIMRFHNLINGDRLGQIEMARDVKIDIEQWVNDNMPSGSGIDCGTKIDIDASSGDKLVFILSYHHMDEHGGYDGWTEHKLTVKPHLFFGITLSFSGRDRNRIKDHLHAEYEHALTKEIDAHSIAPVRKPEMV